jgi:hypothetical protein
MPDLTRFWIDFDLSDLGPPDDAGLVLDGGTLAYRMLGFGCGVTAPSLDEAVAMIAAELSGEPVPPIRTITEDVDVRAVDERIAGRLGNPARLGIWYPPNNLGG